MALKKRDNSGRYIKNTPSTFWERVVKTDSCWLWSGAMDTYGYGKFLLGKRNWLSHRYAFLVTKGKLTKGLMLDHLCRNTKCVNPDHLEEVTHAENLRRGNSTKLSQKVIPVIRELYSMGRTQKYLGSLFGVGQDEISRIVNYKRWSNIKTL